MKKPLILAAVLSLVAAQSFGAYIVVLRNGTQYKAKAKWTIVNGKALFQLENGQAIQIDPKEIDEARSEQTTKLGLGDAKIINLDANMPTAQQAPQQPSLGSRIHLRQQGNAANPVKPAPVAPAVTPTIPRAGTAALGVDVVEKFERAYENVGIYEHKVVATGNTTLRAELTADNEDKVFNAISATSFLMVHNAGVTGASIDTVDLFMKTTTGGSSGRFQMTRADAESLEARKLSQQEYFIRHVIY